MKFWKKIVAGVGLLAAAVGLAACSNNKSTSSNSSNAKSTKVSKASSDKTLILYFSLTGTTKGVAQYIQKQTGAKLIRLQPQKPYGDYDSAAKRGDRERRNNIHPALATKIPNFSKYNTVFIGYPTWWQRPPMLIHTLFDKYDFKGKTVIPFTTSMSTPLAPSQAVIKKLAKDDGANFKKGIRYDNNNKQVRAWLKNLGYEK